MATPRSLGVRRVRRWGREAVLVACVGLGALGALPPAQAQTTRDDHGAARDAAKTKASKAKAKKSAAVKAKGKAKAKAKSSARRKAKARQAASARRRAAARRKADRRPGANMPKGFVWPPSKAMRDAGERCLAALTEAGVAFADADKKLVEPKARLVTPVVVADMKFGGVVWVPTFRKPPFVMDCHLALALHGVGPALGRLGVDTVHFSRIYEFTRVRTGGRQRRAVSRHALGLAVDIRKLQGVIAEPATPANGGADIAAAAAAAPPGGTIAVVHTDYATSAWLKAIETAFNESGLFRTVLSPANDPKSHYDHFHVEAAAAFAP
ncbi:MAG: hypothetical protein IPL79_13380 [Myxococcales bacterium]|nr:hypothetical protein [Myxococcales bacterium]